MLADSDGYVGIHEQGGRPSNRINLNLKFHPLSPPSILNSTTLDLGADPWVAFARSLQPTVPVKGKPKGVDADGVGTVGGIDVRAA